MDLPSKICVNPFIHLSNNTDGNVRLCCDAHAAIVKDERNKPYDVSKNSVDEIWNSEYMKDIRMYMLNHNALPPECNKCYFNEVVGKKSKRQNDNEKWGEEARANIQSAIDNNGHVKQQPFYIDLRLGNQCNLSCQMCNSSLSSSINREVKEYKDLLNKYDITTFCKDLENWWDTDFFKDSYKSLLPHTKDLYISGGEPTIIKAHYEFLDECIDKGYAENIWLRFNTNLTVINPQIMDRLKHFKKVRIFASIDAIGSKNDWIRHGSKWETIEKNFDILNASDAEVIVTPTVSIFNVLYMDELYAWAKEKNVFVKSSILSEPNHLSIDHLPHDLIEIARNNLSNITNHSPEEMNDIQVMLMKLTAALCMACDVRSGNRWKSHIYVYDKIRKTNFFDHFPEFKGYA